MRVLRTAKFATVLRDLLIVLLSALPALFNIGVLLFLLFFVFAVIGEEMFYNVAYQVSHRIETDIEQAIKHDIERAIKHTIEHVFEHVCY